MASFLVARQSANTAHQTLFYVQAIDEPIGLAPNINTEDFHMELLQIPNVSQTKRLPGIVLFHQHMRMRFTTTIQQPFAVQDVECTVIGFDPDPADTSLQARLLSTSTPTAEWTCKLMPKAIYVKLDECDFVFLPPGTCSIHRQLGHDETCEACVSAVQPGVFAVKPLVRTWRKYFLDGSGKYVSVRRRQFPLMPLEAVALYSMQGTTADPGMVAYWMSRSAAAKQSSG